MPASRQQLITPPELRDLAWVRGALQSAIALEHATMPVYSAAMYSLEVQNYPSYNAIRSVLMEEMAHMAFLANMLTALGGTPRIAGLDPVYPGRGLPGGVGLDVELVLAPLSPKQLQNFMRLEAPAFLLTDEQADQPYPTVGDLYRAIDDAVVANAAAVRRAVETGGPGNQVGGNIGFATITPDGDPVAQIRQGIDDIVAQGEGTGEGTIEAGAAFQNEGSHHARFAELWYGRRYGTPDPPVPLTGATLPAYFAGDEITWPVVINTLAVPPDGYAALLARDPNRAAVAKELDAFDDEYTAMMVAMDAMWNGPEEQSWPRFGEAVAHMNELRVLSCFGVTRQQVPPSLVAQLRELYPRDHETLAAYTDLDRPVFYGPRFVNTLTGRVPTGAGT